MVTGVCMRGERGQAKEISSHHLLDSILNQARIATSLYTSTIHKLRVVGNVDARTRNDDVLPSGAPKLM